MKRNTIQPPFLKKRSTMQHRDTLLYRGRGVQWMKRYLLKSDVFSKFNDDTISNVVEDVEPLRVQGGDTLLTQGEVGDMLFVIDKGEYNVIVDGKKVAVLKKRGHVFGELALICSQPRSATICAKTDGLVWCLDRAKWEQHRRMNEDRIILEQQEAQEGDIGFVEEEEEEEEELSLPPGFSAGIQKGGNMDCDEETIRASRRESVQKINKIADCTKTDSADLLIMNKTLSMFKRTSVTSVGESRRRSTMRRQSSMLNTKSVDPLVKLMRKQSLELVSSRSSIKPGKKKKKNTLPRYHRSKDLLDFLQFHPSLRHPKDVKHFAKEIQQLLQKSQHWRLRDVTLEQCEILSSQAAGIKYRRDHYIFGENACGHRGFLVLTGKVLLLKSKKTLVQIVEKGGLIGDIHYLSGTGRYCADARVSGGSANLLVMTEVVLEQFLEPWIESIEKDMEIVSASLMINSASIMNALLFMKCAELRKYNAGQLVTCQKDKARELMVIRSGSCTMWYAKNQRVVENIKSSFHDHYHRERHNHVPVTIRGKYSAAPVFFPPPPVFLCPEDDVKNSLMLSKLVAGSCIGAEIVGTESSSTHKILPNQTMVSACNTRSRKISVEIWCLPPELLSDRVFGFGTLNRLRKMMQNTRAHHQTAVDLALKRKPKVSRRPVVGSFSAAMSASMSPSSSSQKAHRGDSGATMMERVKLRLQASLQQERRNSMSGIHQRQRNTTNNKTNCEKEVEVFLPSFKEIETNIPDSTKQALLLLRVRSKELESIPRSTRRRRKGETLEFAAKNTGRLLLRNLEKLEEDRDDEEEGDLRGGEGFDSLSSMMESKCSFYSAMSASSKAPAAHRLRRMKNRGGDFETSSCSSKHPHYDRKCTLASLWGSQKHSSS